MGRAGVEPHHHGRARLPAGGARARRRRAAAAARQRAARRPGRGRGLAGLVLGAGGPVDHGRGLLRAAPLRPPGLRPAARPRARGGARARRRQPGALLHEALAGGPGPLPLVGAPGAAARDDPAATARAHVALPLRELGAGDLRGADGRPHAQPDLPPAGRARRAVPRAPRRRAGAPSEDAGALDAGAEQQPEARASLQPAPDPVAAAPGRGPGGALDLRAPGGGRLVGRHPAPVGLLDPGPPRARLPPRPPGDRARPGRVRGGLRPRPRRRRAPAHPGVPVAGVGHGAGGDRAGRRRGGARRPGAGRLGRLAPRQGGDGLRRLAPRAAARAPRGLVVRVRQRELPRHRRHGRGPARPPPRRPPALAPGRAAGGRLAARDAERGRRLGLVRRSTTTAP